MRNLAFRDLRFPRLGRAGGFSPAVLFAANEPGVWYDPSDTSTLFADTAGTTPATIGGTVALMLDKSGNGNHATQETAASRPTLRQAGTGEYYLEFDGVDDFLVTPTITPGVDKAQVFAGVRKLSDDALGVLVETSANYNSNAGSFIVANLTTGRYTQSSHSLGGPGGYAGYDSSVYPAPHSAVLTITYDIAGNTVDTENPVFNVNGVSDKAVVVSGYTNQTTNFQPYPLYIGRRGGTSLPFNGHLYSLITRFGPNLDADVIDQTEAYVADKTGIVL